ncbi:MAG: hypothetical protein ABJE10_14235 [bacterium]
MPFDAASGRAQSSDFVEQPKAPPAMPCAECKTILRTTYFSLDGRPLCPRCSQEYRRRIDRGTGPAALGRAILYGGGAALAGMIGVSLLLMVFSGFRIISSIGVAYLVAKAIGKATANYGGRQYQWLAISLTYAALGLAMLMPVFRAAHQLSVAKAPPKREARFGPAGEAADIRDEVRALNAQRAPVVQEDSATIAAREDSLAVADSLERLQKTRDNIKKMDSNAAFADRLAGSAGAMFIGAIALIFLLPILSSFASYGIYTGVISIFALGFALRRAWQMTELVTDYELSGPYRVGSGPIAATIGG